MFLTKQNDHVRIRNQLITIALLLLLVVIIVQRYFCPCCPQVSEETDFIVQSAYGVGTHYRNRLSTSETKILFKKVGRHFPIAHSIRVALCLASFIWFVSNQLATILPPSVKFYRRFQPRLQRVCVCTKIPLTSKQLEEPATQQERA